MHPAESNAIASYERALCSCATAALLIDHSRRKCELSRERLRASGDALLAVSEWVPRRITFIPSRIPVSRVRYVLLFIRGGVQVEACPCGQEYEFARNLNAGILGIFESESDAELQLTSIKPSRAQTETSDDD